jgi:hypothetical protein
MTWTFERTFYGDKREFNLKSIRDFLMRGYYPIPFTLFNGYYRAVNRVGDHDSLYSHIQEPFPDTLLVQRPDEKFALHLSGGFDSSILAKLYDREDADYIHFTGPESHKARALAATLKGRLHEVQITPELYITTADEIASRLPEPYAFEDIVYAYLASRKAGELGHTLVVSGDGGDGVFGGAYVGPYSRKACIIWKTIDPNRLLGLRTLQPYMHTALYAWSKTMLSPQETAFDKQFAAAYCRQLGLPEAVSGQQKEFWAGSHGIRTNQKVLAHMAAVVDNSDYAWIRRFEFPATPCADLPFRQYGLVKWLQVNYKRQLDLHERRDWAQRIEQFNREEKAASLPYRRKEAIKRLIPPIVLPLVRRIRRYMVR